MGKQQFRVISDQKGVISLQNTSSNCGPVSYRNQAVRLRLKNTVLASLLSYQYPFRSDKDWTNFNYC